MGALRFEQVRATAMVSPDKKLPKRDTVERSQEMLEAIYAQIPFDKRGERTSIGSIDHAAGNCIPCLYWFQAQCPRNVHCTYCHIAHPGQKKKRIRPSKKTRLNHTALVKVEEDHLPKLGEGDDELVMWELHDDTWVRVEDDNFRESQSEKRGTEVRVAEDGPIRAEEDVGLAEPLELGDELIMWMPDSEGAWVEVGVCFQSI